MKLLFVLGLAISTSLFGLAKIEKLKNGDALRSDTLKELLPKVADLHKAGEKEYRPAGGRETVLFKVTPARGQKEWQAMRELVDEVNGFGEVGSEDYDEDATAFYRKDPNWQHISIAFASDFKDRDDLSKEYIAKVYKLRNELRDTIREKEGYMAFYRVFSSNEAQGHLGFVVYNRGSNEALYVSTISDH